MNYATSNRQDEARVDIAARDFWSTGQKAFFDVKVFNPYAKSNQKFTLASCFNHHEKSKKRVYKQRIVEVEHGSFTTLIFSTTGGMGRLASIFYLQPTGLATGWNRSPAICYNFRFQCLLSFSLLRSSILCIRGTRSHQNYNPQLPASFDLAVGESRVAVQLAHILHHHFNILNVCKLHMLYTIFPHCYNTAL